MLALVLTLSSMSATAAPAPGKQPAAPADPQYFQDIAPGSFFYPFTTNLYLQGVVSGYTCGTPPAGACVPPGNLPYYVPNINVTRGLMSIYIDHARTKPLIAISDAGVMTATYNISLTNSYPGADTLRINAYNSGNYGINVTSRDSYAIDANSTNSDAMDASGADWGLYVRNSGASNPAVDAGSSGTTSYAGYFYSSVFRAGYVKSGNNGRYSLYVDTQDGPTQATAGLEVNGSIRGEGNLYMGGSKAGYVVDEMRNADSVALEPGDVVVIAGDSTAPVLGQIPAPSIKLASAANDSAVVGVVDQVMYVPDAATKAAYDAQQQADHDAAAAAAAQTSDQSKSKQKLSPMADIKNRISDAAGTLHADPNATSVAPGKYCSVVTLGAYKAVKVDASFGAIHPGDLLTTSSHAGYAMRADPDKAKMGSIIGKAMGSLESGSGTITVMVTLK